MCEVRVWAQLRLCPPLGRDGGSLWSATPTGSAALPWALIRSVNGYVWEPAGSAFAPELVSPCPGSPVLSRNFTSKVSGALGPTGWTVHSPPSEARLWKYFSSFLCARGMDSDSRTSSGDGGQALEAMAVRVWLARVSGTLRSQGRGKSASRPRDPGCKVSVSFPERSLPVPRRSTFFPLLCGLVGPSPGE